jgi:RNA polymerase sigma-70 factor (ECF subfamily)
MKKATVFTIGMMLLMTIAGLAEDKTQISIKMMPPSVVETVPQAGDTQVDPSIKEIRVTFSKEMMTERMWSWCMHTKDTFPKMDVQKIHYLEDKRTCVAPVELEPGKTYVIWINSQNYNAFRDTQNNPAVPYLLVFETRKE